MKLYLISRTDDWDYDEYDAVIVAAENEESAFKFSPRGDKFEDNKEYENEVGYHGWTSKENLKIEYIGESDSTVEKVILASFNAG